MDKHFSQGRPENTTIKNCFLKVVIIRGSTINKCSSLNFVPFLSKLNQCIYYVCDAIP